MKRVIKAANESSFPSYYYGLPNVMYNGEKGLIQYKGYTFNERLLEELIKEGEFGNFDPDREEIDQYMPRTLTKLLDAFVSHPGSAEGYDLIVGYPGNDTEASRIADLIIKHSSQLKNVNRYDLEWQIAQHPGYYGFDADASEADNQFLEDVSSELRKRGVNVDLSYRDEDNE